MQNAPAEAWRDVVREAVNRGVARGGAVPGSRLRVLVAAVAVEKGLQYPPDDSPEITFAQFLSRYPDLAVVRHRPKQDMLVAPASQPELLVEPPRVAESGPLPGIRRDLFDSFTRLSTSIRAWYVPDDDSIIWRAPTTPPESQTWVAIPQPTIQQAIDVRQRFAESISDLTLKHSLLAAIGSAKPLVEFTNAVRLAGLQRDWHRFRTSTLVEHMKGWAREAGVSWRDSWITVASGEDPYSARALAPSRAAETPHEWRRALAFLVQSLDGDDLRRISIPLDIVLKALQQR